MVVASNLFGDILSDLGPACTGTIGIAPSGNINPENKFPSLFEPVHGSAPDIAGKGIANPVGQIWSGAMMLDYLGEKEASNSIVEAIEKSLSQKNNRTKDLGGDADTIKCSKSILSNLYQYSSFLIFESFCYFVSFLERLLFQNSSPDFQFQRIDRHLNLF